MKGPQHVSKYLVDDAESKPDADHDPDPIQVVIVEIICAGGEQSYKHHHFSNQVAQKYGITIQQFALKHEDRKRRLQHWVGDPEGIEHVIEQHTHNCFLCSSQALMPFQRHFTWI